MAVRLAGLTALLLLAVACGPPQELASPATTPSPNGDPTGEPADVASAPACEDLRASATVDGPLSDDPEVALAQASRAEMGLSSDEATVAEVLATTGPDYAFGFPHTEEEFDEILARNDPGVDIGEVRGWAYGEAPERYAGMWLDHTTGGTLKVAFTGDVESLRAAAAGRFDHAVTVVEAEHSLADLQALQQEISAEIEPVGEPVEGPMPSVYVSTYVAEDLNRVAIGATGLEDRAAEISERFGTEMICLELRTAPGPEQAEVAPWESVGAVDPSATEIDVHVHERDCASGQPATGRIPDPEITYGEDVVVVTIRVIPPPGDQTCPSNPPTPFTLVLDEPLGDRTLLDGGQDPPGPPFVDQ
jgi:hypothetical protein